MLAPEISIRSYGPSPGSHAHDYFQILWCLNGSLELEIEGRASNLASGTGIVIAPNERHDFESHEVNRCLVLNTADLDWAARQRSPASAKAMNYLAHFIAESISSKLPISIEYTNLLFAQSWGSAPESSRVGRQIDWVGLTQWAKERLAGPLMVRDLADRVCLSESQFRARCIAALGCTPMQWLRQLRHDQAQLLRARGMSIAEVAKRVGYNSPSALTAAIRREKAV